MKKILYFILVALFLPAVLLSQRAFAGDRQLQTLIDEALKNNPELLASEARFNASKFRIPQAKSLPDPMFMFGYQNEGTRNLYTFGNDMAPDSQWMFSLSQMFPFPGKLDLKGKMAARDAESLNASLEAARLKIAARVKELYYELFLAYKNIDIIKDRAALFSNLEDASLLRYSSGMATQLEILMAQSEKYMLLEKEEMLKQKIQSNEGMLSSILGRDVNSQIGKPEEISQTKFVETLNELISIAYENSPEIKSRGKMIASAETKTQMAKREYYPDFTLSASYFAKSKGFPDMWSLTTTVNIPIFYKTKQDQAVAEAAASLKEAISELEGLRLMVSSFIRENYSMVKAAERIMELYKNALIPKTYQDFELALVSYKTGKVDLITVMNSLKSLFDFELSYWGQFVEREKAIARIEAITGINRDF